MEPKRDTYIVPLPSPFWDTNDPNKPMVQGEDTTETVKDFIVVVKWSVERDFGGGDFYKSFQNDGVLNYKTFYALIKQFAFNPKMFTPDAPNNVEYAIWQFSGHGVHKGKLSIVERSGFRLNRIEGDNYSGDQINEYLQKMCEDGLQSWRYLQGGELVFQRYGYVDFHMLIDFVQAAIEGKTNKHVLVILDSCYSGVFTNNLKKWANGDGASTVCDWREKVCSLTIQTAASEEEPTYGGYFTPLYIKLQEDEEFRDTMLEQWGNIKSDIKEMDYDLPSPQLYSTDDAINSAPGPLYKCNNNVWLVKDPDFFKMCYIKDPVGNELTRNMRTLSQEDATAFLSTNDYKVVDFKLRQTFNHSVNPPFAAPTGFFLIHYDKKNIKKYVCVHIHFQKSNTSQVGRINLQEHSYRDKKIWLPQRQTDKKFVLFEPKTINDNKSVYWDWKNDTFHYWDLNDIVNEKDVNITPEEKIRAKELVSKCKSFFDEVAQKSPQLDWNNISKWNKKGDELSFNKMFKFRHRRCSELLGNLALMGYKDGPKDALHQDWRTDCSLETVLQSLKEKKNDPLTIDGDGLTALHVAAASGKVEFLRHLIGEQKLNPMLHDNFRRTPLHLASYEGHISVVKYLVEEIKCDTTMMDINDNTPLDIARGDEVRSYYKEMPHHAPQM